MTEYNFRTNNGITYLVTGKNAYVANKYRPFPYDAAIVRGSWTVGGESDGIEIELTDKGTVFMAWRDRDEVGGIRADSPEMDELITILQYARAKAKGEI